MKQHYPTLMFGTLLLLVASWFGISNLQDDPLYFDETITVFEIGNPYGYYSFAEVIEVLPIWSAILPPGYHLQLSLWVRLSGYSQVGLRAYSAFLGLISLALIYRLARDYYNRNVGLVAMGLASVNMLYLFYFHEMRMYSLAVLTLTLFLWAYLRVFPEDKQPKRRDWVLLWLATVLLIYTHYFTIFTVFAVCLFHLLFVPKNRHWWAVVGTLGLAGLTFLPWLGVVFQGASSEMAIDVQGSALEATWYLLLLFSNGNVFLTVAAFAGLIIAIFTTKNHRRYMVWVFIFSWGAFVTVQQLQQIMPDYRMRYLLLFYPSLIVLVSIGITRYIRLVWAQAGIILLWFVAGLLLLPTDNFWFYNNRADFRQEHYPPFPQMMNIFYSEQFPSSQDVILSIALDEPVYGLENANDFYSMRLGAPMLALLPSNWEAMLRDNYPDLATAPSIWWAPFNNSPHDDARNEITQHILETHKLCDSYRVTDNVHMARYGVQSMPCDWIEDSVTSLTYVEEDIVLLTSQATFNNNTLTVGTAWEVDSSVPLHQYSVALRVYDNEGNFIVDTNFGLPYGFKPQHIASIPLNDATDTTAFEVRMVVYNWQTGDTLTVDRFTDALVPIATVITTPQP